MEITQLYTWNVPATLISNAFRYIVPPQSLAKMEGIIAELSQVQLALNLDISVPAQIRLFATEQKPGFCYETQSRKQM